MSSGQVPTENPMPVAVPPDAVVSKSVIDDEPDPFRYARLLRWRDSLTGVPTIEIPNKTWLDVYTDRQKIGRETRNAMPGEQGFVERIA